MSKIYHSYLCNTATKIYQAVPKIRKEKHKTTNLYRLRPIYIAILASLSTVSFGKPTGGEISAGQAHIQQTGNITNIHQSSQNAAINWQNFGIAAHETVNFHQPNAQSVTLNRVIGNEQSVIDGAMNANGKVFISNPNGMLIGKDAQINVGSLVATTGKISDEDFMRGQYRFDQATGKITQLGNIHVPKGGTVAIIAAIVENKGTISAAQGNTLLASAEAFSITLPDNAHFSYTLDKGTLQGLIDNGGAILADGGRIVLTAQGIDKVKKSLIKHTGIIEANTVQNKNGVIELLGDLDNSHLEVSGSLKAEAQEGNGGFIETSAASLFFADSARVSTQAQNGQTGTWLIDPKDFTVAPSGGDITGTQVTTGLRNNNVTLKSRDGAKEGKGDVVINDEISWNANTLTLNAENNIHINKTLNGTGTAKLALEYGQATSDGKVQVLKDGKTEWQDNNYFLDEKTPLKDRTVKVNLPEGQNFITQKGSNGEKIVFDVIHQMPEIKKNADGDWESKFTARNIAFGTDIDVGYTKNYEGFAGWELPKDNIDSSVSWSRVTGLGHTVNNLTLHSKKDQQSTGLFTSNGIRGHIRDIGVTNVNIKSEGSNGHTGGLLGQGYNISNSYATGTVSTSGSHSDVGGLVGYGHKISNSYATGTVSIPIAGSGTVGLVWSVGGLVGRGADISNSYATGNVSTSGASSHAGGLLGTGGSISNSYATGNVSTSGASSHAGGLVGDGNRISNSYATGTVSTSGASSHAGGLTGTGSYISNSYAIGTVSTSGAGSHAGGLEGMVIGFQTATLQVMSQLQDLALMQVV